MTRWYPKDYGKNDQKRLVFFSDEPPTSTFRVCPETKVFSAKKQAASAIFRSCESSVEVPTTDNPLALILFLYTSAANAVNSGKEEHANAYEENSDGVCENTETTVPSFPFGKLSANERIKTNGARKLTAVF